MRAGMPLTLALLAAAPSAAAEFDGTPLPDRLNVHGHELVLTSCAMREAMWTDLYLAALYLPPETVPRQAAQPDLPKAFRIEVVYEGNVPEEAPEGWREAVRRKLDHEMQQVIRDAYEGAETGDVITIGYAPGEGTTITVNGESVLRQAGHEGVSSILQMWMGDQAVSRNMRRLLLQPGCG